MASDEDLYALLGVDARATVDVIKAAYRQRAREQHPDGKGLGPEEAASAELHMATLNRAWQVLSDPTRRRQYDEQRHVDELLRRPVKRPRDRAPRATARANPDESPKGPAAPREPRASVHAIEASHLIRDKMLSMPALRWERTTLKGFDWALAAKARLSQYLVALHHQEGIDPESAKSFVAAARTAALGIRASGRHFVFVLLAERASAPEQVRSYLRDFSESAEGKGCSVVLVDATRARSLLCSPPPRDEKTRGVLALLGL